MTLPANIRVNTAAPFPAKVKGAGLIAISKTNGIWTVSINFGALGKSAGVADPANSYVLVWNAATGAASMVQIGAVAVAKNIVTLNGAGPYAAQPNDDVILVKFTPMAITVDWLARIKPLRIVDAKGDASVNNITITPAVGQTQLAVVNYVYTIDGNGASVTLTPLPDATGAY